MPADGDLGVAAVRERERAAAKSGVQVFWPEAKTLPQTAGKMPVPGAETQGEGEMTMTELEQYRREIDAIDGELVQLFQIGRAHV